MYTRVEPGKGLIMGRIILVTCLATGVGILTPVQAGDFEIAFEWGDIPKCTTGRPNQVDNPVFTLSNVPKGTVQIHFKMKDRDVPTFDHGGGKVDYIGIDVIEQGAFKYKSPCPPSGKHTYEWTGTAIDGNGDKLGKAKARKKYP